MEDNRPPCYYEGDTLVIRASALGMSNFVLAAHAKGIKAKTRAKELQKAFDDGHRLEDEILAGSELEIYGQQDEVTLGFGQTIVRGHIDGRTTHALVEAKAFAESTYESWVKKGWAGFLHYAWQFSLYGHLIGVTHGYFVVGVKDPKGDGLLAVKKQSLELPKTLDEIEVRVEEIVAAVNAPLPDFCDCGNAYFCDFGHLPHDQAEVADVVEDAELADALNTYNAAKEELKKWTAIVDFEKANMQTYLDDNGLSGKKLRIGNYLLTDTKVAGKRSFDKVAAIRAGIDVEGFYKVGKAYRTLSVREVESE